ncbi:MAG: hypothetical protein ACJAZ3_001959 [Sphingobacteriales bacterium]|jgi:hypothetical protein
MRYIFYFIFCIGFINSSYSQTDFISADSTKQLLESNNWVIFTNKDDFKIIDTLILNSNVACFTTLDQLKVKGYIDMKVIENNQIEFNESRYTGESITTRSYIDECNVYKYKIQENRNGDIILSIKNKFHGKMEYKVTFTDIQSCEFNGSYQNKIIKLKLTKPKRH